MEVSTRRQVSSELPRSGSEGEEIASAKKACNAISGVFFFVGPIRKNTGLEAPGGDESGQWQEVEGSEGCGKVDSLVPLTCKWPRLLRRTKC